VRLCGDDDEKEGLIGPFGRKRFVSLLGELVDEARFWAVGDISSPPKTTTYGGSSRRFWDEVVLWTMCQRLLYSE